MKFLLDENVDFPVALFLRKLSFDVKTITETEPSIKDNAVLDLANREDRILITNDKDFGKLIFKEKFQHKGVIFLRLEDESSRAKIERLTELLSNYTDKLVNNFVVVTENKIRINEF